MSSWQTPKTNWGQPGQTVPGVNDFNRIEGNIETLGRYDRAPGYGTATGTNAKTITLNPAPGSYYDGLCFAFKNETQNTGAVTINVNGMGAKAIKKPNGNDVPAGFLKSGSIYTVRYNGTNFILQGSDSSGNATPDDVRAGKTFSSDAGPDQVGTLPERQGDNSALSSTVSGNKLKLVAPRGIYDGEDDTVTITDNDWIPENIREGINVFGKVGSMKDPNIVNVGNLDLTTPIQGSHDVSDAYVNIWHDVIQYTVNVRGTIRCRFQLRGNSLNERKEARGRILKNGAVQGSVGYSNNENWGTVYTRDIQVVPGDIITFQMFSSYYSEGYRIWFRGDWIAPVIVTYAGRMWLIND